MTFPVEQSYDDCMKFIAKKGSRLQIVIAARTRMEVEGRLIASSLDKRFPQGLTVQFERGVYETDDKDIIDALKASVSYGTRFFSDEPAPDKPTREAVAAKNETESYSEELRSQCPECGKKFKNEAGLTIHMRSHENGQS